MKKVFRFSFILLSFGLLSTTGKAQSLTHAPLGATNSITMNVQAIVSNYPPFGLPTASLQSFYFPTTLSTQSINNLYFNSVLTDLTFNINIGSGTHTVYLNASEIQSLNSAPNTSIGRPLTAGTPCLLRVISAGNNNFTFRVECY
ncbi:hypothetical protein [Taibaiella sp. KBW10]|uniref:hypothetical protein n=1 Tax=Taibaiella sp. KBW10 TaxID=2153357 RepID=UPI000F59709B|nr:hypothetical protein [Taibaiella sp. KBW10]